MRRNITIDYLKLIMSFFVIIIHIPIFTNTPIVYWFLKNGICTVAVPTFFMINGYYLVRQLGNKQKNKLFILHLLKIYIVWSLIYLPFSYSSDFFLNIKHFFFGYFHLWYLVSMLGGVILIFVFTKVKMKLIYMFGIAISLYYSGYFLLHFHQTAQYTELIRSFLFVGFPFMTAGVFVNKYEHVIRKQKTKNIFILLFILLILLLTESYLEYKGYIWSISHSIYISLYPLSIVFLSFILKLSRYKEQDNYVSNLSGFIYFVHYFWIFIFLGIFSDFNLFLIVLFISILSAGSLLEINKRLKYFQ